MARIGYAAKAAVYVTIGVLAVMTAAGFGGDLTDSKGAIAAIGSKPLGGVFLVVLGIGLIGYTVWCIVFAWLDPDGEGTSGKALAKRIGMLGSGLVHAGLAYTALHMALAGGSGGSGGSGGKQSVTAKLLQQPFGALLIGIVGAAVIGYGVYQWVKAYRADFTKLFKTEKMSRTVSRTSVRIGKAGIVARGVVFAIIGYFLIQTAVQADPSETKGIDGALVELANQPYGSWLLGAVALGVVAYGVYTLILARYRRTVGKDRS
ncbi:DUF1206 domain-containing protein [Paenibacillus sp. IB182496]|uniref:DUF1206 domain-containing protein n=1 Tax=Paenibacillus sabuli TaxID=2772509 RepID=A0A927GQM8_9BACL|nr:DUF1206 domain-containing protein [Paenibacillus sabuli]